jgi:hypothetical protein
MHSDGEELRSEITKIWPDNANGATLERTFELEAELIANTVSHAILNPSKIFNFLYRQTSNYSQCRVY